MKLFCVPLILVPWVGAQTPRFEVASIKPNRSDSLRSSSRRSPGQIQMENVSLRKGILIAYGIPDDREFALIGPPWLTTERFDIIAKCPSDTPPEQVLEMLQNLYAERFHLVLHRETRQMPTYSLVVAKAGAKFQPVEDGSQSTSGRPGHLEATSITMDKLANLLSRMTGQPVVNETGLTGVFTFTLEWTPDETQRSEGSREAETHNVGGPSLFSALQEQLGLKLEGKKAPAEVLIVDRVERTPTEN
jgi:uncharacterized protein (TIGR03435 family)